jgi:outer membrane protein assembly factor BamA
VRRLLHSALAVLLVGAAPLALAEDEPVVKAIEVEGNRRVEVDAIKGALSTKPGDSVDAARIRADVRAVMKLGYFADVSIEARGPARAHSGGQVKEARRRYPRRGGRVPADDFWEAIEAASTRSSTPPPCAAA